ncbi:MAG: sodium-dependent bicarbonate transport family permease [Alphaproteobacteria bacterium]|nr:sodium-dependent bicarbonate transport family permease [Alphaproteobacteria bacterium SS10]
MDLLADFFLRFLTQLQSPTLGFLIGGILLGASGSKLQVPDAIYQFAVFMLLMRVGLNGGMEIREADLSTMALPAFMAVLVGLIIVFLGRFTLARLPGVKVEDGIATAGLFGAVSASTLAAAMVVMEQESLTYEAWAPALYPFMDIPALILAIVLAKIYLAKGEAGEDGEGEGKRVAVWPIIRDSLRGSALSALILGLILGLVTNPERVFDSFYDPLFRGLLSILMLIMGMEAWTRLAELRRVAHWYAVYAALAPIVHGLIAFGLGYIAHVAVGFSPGGVVILAVLAASSSDISGPPTLRGAIPTANPSSYIGASTSVGTPVAVAICIPLFIAMADAIFK